MGKKCYCEKLREEGEDVACFLCGKGTKVIDSYDLNQKKCDRCDEVGQTETINNEWLCFACESMRTDLTEINNNTIEKGVEDNDK